MNALNHLTSTAVRNAHGVCLSVAASDVLPAYCLASSAVLGSQIGIYQGWFSTR